MKTQLRIRSLRNLVVSAIVAASLNIALSAQPNPERNYPATSYSERLDRFMDVTEQSLRYTAPDALKMETETEKALQNLDQMASVIENRLKYTAPVNYENQIDQELELLAHSMMEKLEYHAPVYDEFTNTFGENPVMSALKTNVRLLQSDNCTPQEAWLINAGYFKSNKKPAMNKIKNVSSGIGNEYHADEL